MRPDPAQGDGDVGLKGPGDGFCAEFLSSDLEVTAGSDAPFPGLTDVESEENDGEDAPPLPQPTAPVIQVDRAYFTSTCGSL